MLLVFDGVHAGMHVMIQSAAVQMFQLLGTRGMGWRRGVAGRVSVYLPLAGEKHGREHNGAFP